jgi:hypothetical protein
MEKKFTSGSGMVCIIRTQASGMLRPTCWDSIDAAELGLHRLLAVRRDEPQRVVQGQARLDGAHHDVQCVREFDKKALLPPLDEKTQYPAWHAYGRRETGTDGEQWRRSRQNGHEQDDDPEDGAHDVELRHPQGQARLDKARFDTRIADLAGLLLLLLLKLLEAVLDRLAALRHFLDTVARRLDLAHVGLRRLDAAEAGVRLLLGLDAGEEQCVAEGAGSDGGEGDDQQDIGVETEHQAPTPATCSIASNAAASRRSSLK